MPTALPPLHALRAFEASARHLSVTLAAQELNVTPGAVSLQVRELEMALGVALFLRRPRQLTLTPEGAAYFTTIRIAFRMIREATAETVAQAGRVVLTVSCTPSFAAQWLVPRLGRFEALRPDVDVRISASNRVMDFSADRIDIAIRHGFGRYDGLASERLLDDELTPVCSPDYLTDHGRLATPGDLAGVTLLHDEHRHDWRLWCEAAGAHDIETARGPLFVDSNGAIDAAKAGLGVALVRLSLVEKEIAGARLVAPLPQAMASDLAYHLVYPATALARPTVKAFRDWLISEIS